MPKKKNACKQLTDRGRAQLTRDHDDQESK